MMLPGPPKVTVMLGTRFVPLDNAERLECVTANRLRSLLWTGKAAGLGSSLPSPSCQRPVAGRQPWGEGGTSRTAGTESMGSAGGLSELCATPAWAPMGATSSHCAPLLPLRLVAEGARASPPPTAPQPQQRWRAAVPAENSEYPGHLFIPALQDLFLPL